MAAPQGTCSFNGIVADVRASMTLSHGITPSSCSFEVSPDTFGKLAKSEHGTLEFRFAGTSFQFPGCRVKAVVAQPSESGNTIILQIVDRRWRWQFGAISGRYNTRAADGKVIEEFEKTPRELAKMLLDRMGEPKPNLSNLPDQQRPEVDWIAEPPASALAALCDQLGCRVVLNTDNRVSIEVVGTGAKLPSDGAMTVSFGMELPGKPDELIVLGGPTRFQVKLELEAVGVDIDEKIELIDDLPYKPDAGWGLEFPDSFSGVVTDADRARALKTVFRWYRIKQHADGTLNIPGYDGPEIETITDLLPVSRDLVETYTDADSVKRPKPAVVTGVYSPNEVDYQNTEQSTTYPGSWDLDAGGGIVRFSEPVFKFTADGSGYIREAAELYLLATCEITDNETNQKSRHTRERKLGGKNGTGPRVLRHDELIGTAVTTYEGADVDATTDNLEDWNREADYYLDAAEAEYDRDSTGDIQYDTLRRIDPDGAIQQVTWSVGPNGATTRASRNTEYNLDVPSYDERRRQEQVIAAVVKAQGAKS